MAEFIKALSQTDGAVVAFNGMNNEPIASTVYRAVPSCCVFELSAKFHPGWVQRTASSRQARGSAWASYTAPITPRLHEPKES